MIERFNDWRPRLFAYLAASVKMPFAYGSHDCALFASGAVDAMTGVDPASAFRGRYTTLIGGVRVARKAGFNNHVAVFAALFAEVPVLTARVGDLAVIEVDGGQAVGVVQGAHVSVLTPNGRGLVDLTTAVKAFRV